MQKIPIYTPFIKIDQLLKFAGFAATGAEAKELILQGCIRVDGKTEQQRGRKIYPGMVVCVAVDGTEEQIYVEGEQK